MSESPSCLSIGMRILAAICALVFIVTLPFSLLAFFTSSVIFTPEELSGSLTESLIASGRLRSTMTEFLTRSAFVEDLESDEDVHRALSNLSEDEWNQILDIVVPDAWLEMQIKESVTSLNIWLDDDSPQPNIQIDMRPIKAKMQDAGTLEIIEVIVDSWPSCTEEQIADMHRVMESTGQTPILFCEPPEPYRSELVQIAARQFRIFFRDMPPTFSLLKQDSAAKDVDEILLIKERIRMVRAFTTGGWLLSAALLGLIMILAIRSWRDVAIWWGIPILIVGIMTTGLGLSMNTFSTRLMKESLSNVAQESPAMYDMLLLTLSALREKIIGNVTGAGILLGITGVVLILVGWFFGRLGSRRLEGEPMPGEPRAMESGRPPMDSGYSAPPPPPPVKPPPEDGEEGEKPSGIFG